MRNRVSRIANQNLEESKQKQSILPGLDIESPHHLYANQSREQYRDLFDSPPVPFKARRSKKLDEEIAKVVKKHNSTLPVIHIRNGLYLVGTNRCNCELRFN